MFMFFYPVLTTGAALVLNGDVFSAYRLVSGVLSFNVLALMWVMSD